MQVSLRNEKTDGSKEANSVAVNPAEGHRNSASVFCTMLLLSNKTKQILKLVSAPDDSPTVLF